MIFFPRGEPENCAVTLTGEDGVEHSVEVTAGTVYEAAIRGLRELKLSDWSRKKRMTRPI
jgi:hypothetical protein